MRRQSSAQVTRADILHDAKKQSRPRICLLAGISLACFPFDAVAAQDAAAEPQDRRDEQKDELTGEIIVTARRREESLQDVPVAVTAIGGETLRNYAVADITAIAQLVPSMVVGRQVTGSSASIFLRGVGSSSLSAGFDQSVSINLDGIPMSRGRELVTSQFDIRQVEILKGPQALFFGKNSTGGVITVKSANPTDDFEARAMAGYEFRADEAYGEGMISGPLGGGFRGRVALRGSDMKGYFQNAAQANTATGFLREPLSSRRGEARNLGGRLTLDYDGGNWFDANLKLQATELKDNGPSEIYERKCAAGRTVPRPVLGIPDPSADCLINGVSTVADVPEVIAATMPYARDGDPYTDHISYLGAFTANANLDKVALTSVTGYQRFKQSDLNSMAGSTGGIYVSQFAEYRQFTQELRAITSFDGPLNATVGAIFADSSFEFNTSALVAGLPVDAATGRYDSFNRDNGFDGRTYSAFAELRWTITPKLELAGGARYTKEAKDSYSANVYSHPRLRGLFPLRAFTDRYREGNISPQATLTWEPSEDLTLYAAYKEGFKAGGFNISWVIGPATRVEDGRFGSEKAIGGEIGLRSSLLDRALKFNVTAYNYKYKDLQVQIFDAATLAQVASNAGALRTKGVEAEAALRVPGIAGLNLHGSLAYNDATFSGYVGPCFAGQTIVEGCSLISAPSGAFTSQDFEGRRAPKAPKWAGRLGASYETDVSGSLVLGLSADMSFSSSYNYTDALRDDAVQGSFTRYDAALRLMNSQRNLELALIGRNLTDELIITSANDFPGQSPSGTGTNTGVRTDLNAVVDRPRQVYVQLTYRY